MRRRNSARAALLCAVAATAAVPATASAAPVHNRGLTIATTPNHIVAGTGVLIYGQLKGTNVANQQITLYHRIAPAARFTVISRTMTDANGNYEFTRAEGVVVTNRDWFVVGPAHTHSRTVEERVSSTLTMSAASTATTTGQKDLFSGTVYPAHPGQQVLIQTQDSTTGNGWRTIATGRTTAGSTFSIPHTFRTPGDYTVRAFLRTDVRNIAGSSDATTVEVQQKQNPSFTINSSAPAITAGASATISGTLYQPGSTSAPQASVPVELYARGVHGSLAAVASGTTDANGGFSFTESPVNNTVYRVQTVGKPVERTAGLFEAVGDTLTLTPSATSTTVGGQVGFSGVVSPDHSGHAIYLQIETPRGGWQVVAGGSVTSGSNYNLDYRFGKPGTYTVRTRIFGGPLNIGAASTPVTVTVAGDAPVASLPAAS